MKTTGIILSDTHCGALSGLTHPDYQNRDNEYITKPVWDFYSRVLKVTGDVDILLFNGDSIDGQQKKNAGIEQLTTDITKQQEMAIKAIEQIKFKKAYFSFGTPYHVIGAGKDEKVIADYFNAPILDTIEINIDGLLFNMRHVVGTSFTASGHTGQAFNEIVRNIVKAGMTYEEPADVVIRSHAHSFLHINNGIKQVIVTPSMQVPDSIFGLKLKSYYYSIGLIYFEVDDGDLKIDPYLCPVSAVKKSEVFTWKG